MPIRLRHSRHPHATILSTLEGTSRALYAIGDIHGCLGPLQKVLLRVERTLQPTDTVIFLGDYIDRGPHSPEVVEMLLGLPYVSQCVFLRGNHEDMLLQYLDGKGEAWLFEGNGGRATLMAYGGRLSQIPPSHLAFYRALRLTCETPEFLFVHGGIRPGVPIRRQRRRDLLWIREEFINAPGTFPKPVVFGHTPMPEPLIRKDRMGIDTGCVMGGKLTCLRLPVRKLIQEVSGFDWRERGETAFKPETREKASR